MQSLVRSSRSFDFFSPFQRLKIALSEPETRVHFALVCGAKSCPPIKTYSVEVRNKHYVIITSSDQCLSHQLERGRGTDFGSSGIS